MADLNYELAPTPGTPASVRKGQLDAARYVAVRNLAHMIYKKPDGSALMTFGETLDERDKVKATIIGHEISLGLLVNDLQPGVVPAAQPQAVPMAAPVPVAAPAPQAVPQQMSLAGAPPNGSSQFVPQMAVPPAATPQAAAAAGAAPQEQSAPPAVPARKRRTAAGVGAAVAPPPASPAGVPAPQAAPPAFSPPPQASFAPPAAAPQMTPQAAFTPAAFTPPVGPAPVPQPVAAPSASVSVDLSPILAKLDQLGAGLAEIAKDGEQLKAENAALKKILTNVFGALHHIYMVDPVLKQSPEVQQAGTLAAFEAYLSKFTGNPS